MKRNKRQTRNAADETELVAAIGRRLRQIRGFETSQVEFARRLGISQSQLSKYERGQAAPTAQVLRRLKESFGVSVDWVLTGHE